MTETNRFDLIEIIKEKELNGIGVEIGVAFGNFSDFLITKGNFQKFYSIDPWHNMSADTVDTEGKPFALDHQEHVYDSVKTLLSKHGDRSEIIRDFSYEASKRFDDDSIDFIYIDGSHKKDNVALDLETWYPKLKRGGLCAGHDYLDGVLICKDTRDLITQSGTINLYTGESHTEFGVKSAVDEFVDAKNLKLNVIEEETVFHSWFFIKE